MSEPPEVEPETYNSTSAVEEEDMVTSAPLFVAVTLPSDGRLLITASLPE
ncbi:hypothetical protein Barb4_00981 [Bacteroidales bacterium Barb4]|nr:hypothetical protein Barb4_00981 [Bacteroidales bacterium Barb4]